MKAIIQKLLNNYFGKWISGVDRENLHFSLLSGRFKVNDISLNQTYFDSLDIPVRVSFSHIGQLDISAPITKFGSVTCILSDLFVIVEFKDESNIKNNDQKLKQNVMEKYAKSLLDHFVKKVNQEKDGMMKGVLKKVINNLQLKIRNIHVRFEEQREKTKFCFGMTIKEISFLPTDQHWNIQKQNQAANQEEQNTFETIYKKMKIEEFNLYWDESPEMWIDEEEQEIMKLMKKHITTPSSLVFHISTDVRVKIENGKDPKKPLYEVFIMLNGLDLELTRIQIQQILLFVQKLTLHSELKLIMRSKSVKIDESYKQTFQRYIKQLVLGQNHYNPQIQTIYAEVPAAKLYQWITQKVKVVVKEQKIQEQKKKQSGWFGWWKNSANLEDLEEQIQGLLDDDQQREGGSPFCAVQLKAPEGKLRVSFIKSNVKNYAELTYNDIQILFNISTDSNYLSFNLTLTSIQLDIVEMHKQLKNTVNILNTKKEAEQLFQLTHNKIVTQKSINRNTTIEVSKIVLTLKPLSYKKMKEVFNFGDVQQGIKISVFQRISELKSHEEKDPNENKIEMRSHISVSIASPSIIFPCNKGGYYLLNIGTFTLDAENQKYEISLTQTGFLYYDSDVGDENPDYLIDNTSITTVVTTSSEEKIINVSIPNVSMRMSKNDFSRLLELYQLFNDSKAIRLKSIKDRRAYIENNKQFQQKITLKSSSGGWKNDYLILSGYFIYIYEHQNSLSESIVIPIKGLKCSREEEKLILQKDTTTYILKYDEELEELMSLIQDKNIELATEAQLIYLFTQISNGSSPKLFTNRLHIQIPTIRIRYNTVRPVLDIYLIQCEIDLNSNSKSSDLLVSLKQFEIEDLIESYTNKQYQHFIITKGNPLINLKVHSEILKEYTSKIIDIDLNHIDLNWKPQLFLEIHTLIKQYSKYDVSIEEQTSKDTNWKTSLKRIHQDKQFVDLNQQFQRSQIDVKQNKGKYITSEQYQKHHPLIVFRRVTIKGSVSMRLFHRQTNIVIGKIQSTNLKCQIVQASNAVFVKGEVADIVIYEIGDYSHSDQDTVNKQTHLIFKSKNQSSNIMQFKFSSFKEDQFTNQNRIVKFINIAVNDFEFHYYHQYTMRLFDYFFIQIIYVLTEPELVLANKNLLEQIVKGEIKQEIEVLGHYDDALKKLISPFFTDIEVSLNTITLYLKPQHLQKTFFVSEIKSVRVYNQIKRNPKRFESSNLHQILKKYIWEEDFIIEINEFQFNMLDQKLIPSTNLTLTYNSCLNSNLIKHLFLDLKNFDQTSYINGIIQKVDIEFTRFNYLTFIKFINFNILYQDLLDHLYNHNYLITKSKKPNPILVEVILKDINFRAKHKSKTLMQVSAQNLKISYQRTDVLHKIVGLRTKAISIEADDHPIFRYIRYVVQNGNELSLIYTIQNSNKRTLSLALNTARILASYPTLLILLQWFKLQKWVDTVEKPYSPELTIKVNIENIYFALKCSNNSTLFLKGDIKYQSSKNQNKNSNQQIQQQLRENKMKTQSFNYPLGSAICQMKIQIFRCTFKDFLSQNIQLIKKRTVLNKTEICIQSRQLLKIQPINKIVQPSTDTMVFISNLNLDFSMTDLILFQKMADDQKISNETKELIQQLKQSGHQAVVEKQIFNSVVVSVNESTLHLINNVGDCFVPLLTIDIQQFHCKLNYNKQILEVAVLINPLLKYYNVELMVWQPFLQNCEISIETRLSLAYNKKIMKCYIKNDTIVTVSKPLLQQIQTIAKVVNQLQDDKEQIQTVQYINNVVVVNHTGFDITLNDNIIKKDEQVKIKIPFEKGEQLEKDKLMIQDISKVSLFYNILHCQSVKKITIEIQDNNQNKNIYLIVKPIIKDSRKHIYLKGLYQLNTKQGQTIHYPLTQNPKNIYYKGFELDVSKIQKLKSLKHQGNVYTIKETKQSILINQDYQNSITNCLPIAITINEKELKQGQKLKYSGQIQLGNYINKYKIVSHKNNKYVTCQSHLVSYDQDLKILNAGKEIIPQKIQNKQEFIKNIYIFKIASDKLEAVRNNIKSEVRTDVGKTTLHVQDKNEQYEYNLQTKVVPTEIGIQKIITITPKYILVNSTTQPITINETNKSIDLGVNERKILNFTPTNKNKNIVFKTQNFASQELTLNSDSQSFIARTQDDTLFKILCYDIVLSNNVEYINFTEEKKYKIKNQTQYSMKVYQKDNKSDPSKHFQIKKQQENYFAFDWPQRSKRIVIEISRPNDPAPLQQYLIDLDDTLFEQQIYLNNEYLYLSLTYTNGIRQLNLLSSKFSHSLASLSFEIQLSVSSIGVSVVGVDEVRKQLLYAHIGDIYFRYQYSANQLEIVGSVERFNIENTRDQLAVNQNIIFSKEQTSGPFLQFQYQQDVDSPRVINYFGLSIREFAIFVTSNDIQILKSNFQQIGKGYIPNKQQTHSIINKQIDHSNRYYIDKFEIQPIKGTLTYKSLGDDNSLLKTFANIKQAPLRVNGVFLTNLSCRNIGELRDKIVKTYTQNWYSTVIPLLGNISILGSPASLLSKLGTGFKQFVQLPVEGFIVSPIEGGKGITKGTKSLLKNTIQGTMNSVGGISQSIGSGLATLTLDSQYEKERQLILNRRSHTFMDRFRAGGQSLYKGFSSGIKGVIEQPIKGAEQSGVTGFLIGGFKGITGLALKPISGVVDMTSKTFEGLKSISSTKEQNKIHHHPARIFYNFDREYRVYNKRKAKLNEILGQFNQSLCNLSWIESYQINVTETLIIGCDKIILFNKKKSELIKTYDVKNIKQIANQEKKVILLGSKKSKLLELAVQNQRTLKQINQNLAQIIHQHHAE